MRGRSCGSGHCASDVRAALVLFVFTAAAWVGGGSKRVRRNVRAAVGNLGLLATALRSGAVPCCELHHRGLLVYRVNFICKPGSNNCPLVVKHLCRDSTHRRSVVYRGTDRGRFVCDLLVSLARSELIEVCSSLMRRISGTVSQGPVPSLLALLATLFVDLSLMPRSRDVDRWCFANRQPGYDERASVIGTRTDFQGTAELSDSFSHPSDPNSDHAS
jgi:hypothetical protein